MQAIVSFIFSIQLLYPDDFIRKIVFQVIPLLLTPMNATNIVSPQNCSIFVLHMTQRLSTPNQRFYLDLSMRL